MAEVGPCISKTTLNLNDINTPIERQRLSLTFFKKLNKLENNKLPQLL